MISDSLLADDFQWMARALQLAKKGLYTARPNPCVGCVLVKDNQLLAEGWHYRAGEAHAEVHALSAVSAEQAQGATAYVTLEPCNHHGRTGPCSEALVAAGIVRVVYGMQDPNPQVSGQGLNALRQANIEVVGPVLESDAKKLNPGFIMAMAHQRPYVRCKIAISIDGRTAMNSGESQWITGAAARADVQLLRARSGAIITGIESVLHDDSRLNLRADELAQTSLRNNVSDVLSHPPLRVVLDSSLRIPENAAVLQGQAPTLIISTAASLEQDSVKSSRLKAMPNVDIVAVATDLNGHVSLSEVLSLLCQDFSCYDILLEAGATLVGAFFEQQLIDEWFIYQAPVLLGSRARPMLQWSIEKMMDKSQLSIIDRRLVGQDLRINALTQFE